MLQIIRSAAGSWVVKILFVLLIVSFAVWGIGDVARGVRGGVASVGGETISPAELDREFKSNLQRMRRAVNAALTQEQALQMGFLERALDTLVQRRLLSRAAEAAGLRASDAAIVREVQTFSAFKGPLGQFDPLFMRSVLRETGMNEAQFIEEMRRDLTRGLLVNAIGSGGAMPMAMAESLYRYQQEQRRFEIISIAAQAMPEPAAPDEATLMRFHEDKAIRYTAPEYRKLNVLILDAAALEGEIAVSDEQAQEYYDAHKSDYVTFERRSLTQIVAPDETTAKAIIADLEAGRSIVQAGERAKLQAVPLEKSLKSDLPPALADPAFAAAKGKPVGPVQTAFGFHVLVIDSIEAGEEKSLAQVRKEVEGKVRAEKALDRLYELSSKVEDQLASGVPLVEVAALANGRVVAIDATDSRGLNPQGQTISPPLADWPKALTAAFDLAPGATSPLTEAGQRSFFAVQAESATPATLKPFASVRGAVMDDWRAAQKLAAAQAKGQEIMGRLRDGVAAEKAVAGLSAASIQRPPLMRRAGATGVNMPPALLENLFKAELNAVDGLEMSNGFVIAKLVAIQPIDVTTAGALAEIATLAEQARATMGGDLVEQYFNGLRREIGVSVNRPILEAMYGSRQE
jgi:peptidyl-prolyl cis-trans isomerase D